MSATEKLAIGRVTDYQGNVVNEELTQAEAFNRGYNLDCKNCRHCVCCIGCESCENCTNATNCKNSRKLHKCKNCIDSEGLLNSYNCRNCTHSIACTHCEHCHDCTCCENCVRCVNCSLLASCNGCTEISNVRGFKSQPVRIMGLFWAVTFDDTNMQIGCQKHTIEEWKNFDDITIKKMNGRAKEFWSLWKEVLFRVIDTKRKEEEAL